MYIINASLSEDARKKALERIQSGVESRGGKVKKVFDQGRKKLAYEIEGNKEGYYFLIYFNSNTEKVKEMWQEYHLNEDLLRFMMLRTEIVPEKIEFTRTGGENEKK